MKKLTTLIAMILIAIPAFADGVKLSFKNTELSEAVQILSDLTDSNYIYDDSLKGKITILAPRPVSRQEARQLFSSALDVAGYTIVSTDNVDKILKKKQAKEVSGAFTSKGSGDHMVTRLIPVKHIDAQDVAADILPKFLPNSSTAAVYAPTNTLIVTDTSENISNLTKLIAKIDIASSQDKTEIIDLKYAPAETVASLVSSAIGNGGAQKIAVNRRGPSQNSKKEIQIIPDARTNSILVSGSEIEINYAKKLIAKLDRPNSNGTGVKVIALVNADAEKLAKVATETLAVAGAQQTVKITPDKSTNSIVVRRTPDDFAYVEQIVEQLDVKRRQVFVETLIMELSIDAMEKLGASLQGGGLTSGDGALFATSNLNTGPSGLGGFGTIGDSTIPSVLTQTIQGIMLGGMFNPVSIEGPDGSSITVPAFSALLDISKNDSNVNILSAPRILTSDNEEAEIVVGSNVPIITGRLTDAGGDGLAQSVAVERQDVALTLKFTPQITEGEIVKLNVFQEITEMAPSGLTVGDVNEVGPTLTKRMIKNTVYAEDGKTVALGGLFSTNTQKEISKVPLLGDIPLLGWLFKTEREVERKTSLMVFMTPRVIRDSADMQKITDESRKKIELEMGK